CKYINNFGFLRENALVLGVAGYYSNITRDHGPSLVADAEVHFALQYPSNLLVRMLMSCGMRASFHFPPNNHPLPSREDTAFDFIGHTLPRQLRKCAKTRHNRHDHSPTGRTAASAC